jgi:hypothetical protein
MRLVIIAGVVGLGSVVVALIVGRMFALFAMPIPPTPVEARRMLLAKDDEEARRRRALGRVWW